MMMPLKPQKTDVTSLSNVETSVSLCGIDLSVPILSAPMDTVTERAMVEALADEGGMGVVHRFLDADEQPSMVEGVSPVAGAVGLDEFDRCRKLVDTGANILIADIAHGHHQSFLEFIRKVSQRFDVPIAAGNVATKQGASDLADAGADAVKGGVGPGAACTTREMTGAGGPQFPAVKDLSAIDVEIIADGGVRKPGDTVKALMAGADCVMVGSILGDTVESPRQGEFRGMSTKAAAEDRTDRELKESDRYEEVKEMNYGENSTVKDVVEEYLGGLKSGLSYCGSSNVSAARDNA